MKQYVPVATLSSIILVIVLGLGAKTNFEKMSIKAKAQEQSTLDFQRWLKDYSRLIDVEKTWVSQTKKVSDINDTYALFQTLSSTLNINPDKIQVQTISDFKIDQKSTNAIKVCMTSKGSTGLDIEPTDGSTTNLFKQINDASNRLDISFSGVDVNLSGSSSGQVPKHAVLKDFCLILRKEG